jgi:hypothetical protein
VELTKINSGIEVMPLEFLSETRDGPELTVRIKFEHWRV